MDIKEEITYPDIQKVLEDEDASNQGKIEILKQMLDDERALQRAATESPMNEGDGQNARLRHIELALESFGAEAEMPEDTKAATL